MAEQYLFDFDGTLVDSMPTYVSLMLRILDEGGIPYDNDIVKIITPLGFWGTAKYYRELGIAMSVDEMTERMGRYALEEYAQRIPAKEGVWETLAALKKQGDGLHVLTASPHMTLDPCLKRLGLWDFFDHVWSCDDFHTTKADPDIYIKAAAQIGVPVSDIIFIDDNINAVRTAKKAGMRTYGIYDPSSDDAVEQMKAESDGYLYHLGELLR